MTIAKPYSFRTVEGHSFSGIGGRMHSVDDQPAVVYADGARWWYRDNILHRENGPAVVFPNGVEEWWQNGVRHRIGGPAVTYPNTPDIAPQLRGLKQFWENGLLVREEVPLSVQRFRQMMEQAHRAAFGAAP